MARKGIILLLVFVTFVAAAAETSERSVRPNIIIVMTDDQGYGDTGFAGNPILKTPNIDAFARNSVRFTDFHVSPTCAPTRTALMTGRHEFRSGVTHTIFERERMSLSAVTIANVLKSAGYTTGIFGKWHLGDEAPYQPNRRGFDEVFIHGGGGIGQTYPGSCGDAPNNTYFNPAILHNGRFEKTEGYCTDVFFDQASKWIDAKRKDSAPFFAYITPNTPHVPLQCPEEYAKRYEDKVSPDIAKFYGMIENIDDNFGRLTGKLDEWNISRDTLVIFMTDNGGTLGVKTFNAGMRGRKVTPYHGGTRVPSFWRWPAGFPGGRDCDALTAHLDIFPTLTAIAGAQPPSAVKLDGFNLLPLLRNSQTNPIPNDRTLYTHVGRWEKGKAEESKFVNCSVRNGRYRLVNNTELYDLSADPGETNNVITAHPDIVAAMRTNYDGWWNEILPSLENENATGPAINPFKELYVKQFGQAEAKTSIRSNAPPVNQSPASPEEVWADFDPRVEPLDIVVSKRWVEHGANYTEFYFTGMRHGDERVRIYSIYSAPTGASNLPAVLHIHGGGQTVNKDWLKFWNDRGYAALTFNWGGVWPERDRYALWGSLKQGNHSDAGSMISATEPSVRASSWYLWTRVARRALTALERQPEVDAARLGIFGISMGGTITWPFAAMDKRVKAACAIYGVGWNTYPNEFDVEDPKKDESSTKLWRAAMEPESYAPLVTCPILFLDSSNDQHGKMDWAYRTLKSVPAECRWAFTPRYRHYIGSEEGRNLPLWMDTWLKKSNIVWPASPVATIGLNNRVPELTVTPKDPTQVKKVEFFYALENRNPKNRHWRSVEAKQNKGSWRASLPVMDVHQPVFSFANVQYASGVSLSSTLAAAIPANLGRAKATDKHSMLIDDFSDGTGGWLTLTPATDPIPPIPNLITNVIGPGGKHGIKALYQIPLWTHKIGDPRWRGPQGAKLEFQIYNEKARDITLTVHENEMTPTAKKFVVRRKLKSSDDWQTVSIELSDLKAEDGSFLKSWDSLQLLEILAPGSSSPQPIYSKFRWVR